MKARVAPATTIVSPVTRRAEWAERQKIKFILLCILRLCSQKVDTMVASRCTPVLIGWEQARALQLVSCLATRPKLRMDYEGTFLEGLPCGILGDNDASAFITGAAFLISVLPCTANKLHKRLGISRSAQILSLRCGCVDHALPVWSIFLRAPTEQ